MHYDAEEPEKVQKKSGEGQNEPGPVLWAPPWLERKGLDQARRRLYLPRLPASLRAYKSTADSVLPSRIAPFNHFDNFGELTRRKAICSSSSRLVSPDVRPSAQKPSSLATKRDWRSTHQRLPLFCPVAGLLGKLPLGSEQRVFARSSLPAGSSTGSVRAWRLLALDHNQGSRLLFVLSMARMTRCRCGERCRAWPACHRLD